MKARRVLRFMSYKEAMKLLDKQVVVNNKHHRLEDKSRTNSVGFCFTSGSKGILHGARYLSGIVDFDVALVGVIDEETAVPDKFVKGWGIYSKHPEVPDDPEGQMKLLAEMFSQMADGSFFERRKENQQKLQEWSTVSYSLESFEDWGMYVRIPAELPTEITEHPLLGRIANSGSDTWDNYELIAGSDVCSTKQ